MGRKKQKVGPLSPAKRSNQSTVVAAERLAAVMLVVERAAESRSNFATWKAHGTWIKRLAGLSLRCCAEFVGLF